MGKKINIHSILFFILIEVFTMNSYTQELFSKELKWEQRDTTSTLIFQDTTQIIEWGKNISSLATVHTEKFRIEKSDILILTVDKCSGMYCPSIYVFTKENNLWQLKISSNARLKEQLKIDVDSKYEKIIFKTKSSQIGELPFETLSLGSYKTE